MTEENIRVCCLDILGIIVLSFFIGFILGGCCGFYSASKDLYVEGQQSCMVCEVKK